MDQSGEQAPIPQSLEVSPQQVESTPEVAQASPEVQPKPEQRAGAINQQSQSSPPPISLPPVAAPVSQTQPTPTIGSTPSMAGESEIIERVWVGKAREINEKNKQDPHKQSNETNELKVDYRRKRFNPNQSKAA